MKISKGRIESFSDGVIAIIITIMVLNIPLPKSYSIMAIYGFLQAIFVYFVSFVIVALQWNKHRYLFDHLEYVNNKTIWRNILFLFFLSLMPLFTKWVVNSPDEFIPVIGYDFIFLMVSVSYQFLIAASLKSSKNDAEVNEEYKEEKRFFIVRFVIFIIGISLIFLFSIVQPKLSIILFIGLPVVISFINLFHDNGRESFLERRNGSKRKMKL